MMASGSGRKREVMKGVIQHDSKEGRHTKAGGIHMFSHFLRQPRLELSVLLLNEFFFLDK